MSKARGLVLVLSIGAALVGGAAVLINDWVTEPALTIRADPAVRGMTLPAVPIVLDPGALRAQSSPTAPAVFLNMAPNTTYRIAVGGGFLADPSSARTNDDGVGYGFVNVVALDTDTASDSSSGVAANPADRRETWAEMDIRAPDVYVLVWKTDDSVIVRSRLPAEPLLQWKAIRQRWQQHGAHKLPTDRVRDLAVVRVARDTPVSRVADAVEQLTSVKRPFATDDGEQDGPAFDVSVRLMPPPVPTTQ